MSVYHWSAIDITESRPTWTDNVDDNDEPEENLRSDKESFSRDGWVTLAESDKMFMALKESLNTMYIAWISDD